MFVDGERRPQAPSLGHVADPELCDLRRVERGQFLAREPDRPAGYGHQPHDRLAQRRLAHAVPADHGEDAVVERQVDALQRMGMAVIDIEPGDLQHRRG